MKPVIFETSPSNRESMFFAYKNFQRAARNDRWKIIKYNVKGKIFTQLFDLKTDPYETINLAKDNQYKNQLLEMEELLVELMIANNDKANLAQPNWGVPILLA